MGAQPCSQRQEGGGQHYKRDELWSRIGAAMGQHVNFDGKKNQFNSITTEQTSEK